MPDKLCLKRVCPSSSTKKKVIVDSSSSSEDESVHAWSGPAQARIRKSPSDSLTSSATRKEPAKITTTTPKTLTVDSTSDDDDDSLLKPMVVTKRRRVTDSPTFLSKNERNPSSSKAINTHASDDSSTDTADLKKLLLKPKPSTMVGEKSTLTTSPKYASHPETRQPSPHSREHNPQANDDSSEDTQALAKILLGKHYSPPATTRENPPTGSSTLPTEINTAPPSANRQDYSEESDNFELPEPDESSASSVASTDSQQGEGWDDRKLPARVQPVRSNDESRVQSNPYYSGGASKGGSVAVRQEQCAPISQHRNYTDPSVQHNNHSGAFTANSTEPNALQTRLRPPDPSQLLLRDLREAALFDASGIDYDVFGRSSPSPTTRDKFSVNVRENSQRQLRYETSNDRLEEAAFFGGSPCFVQAKHTPTHVRMGLHSPRQTPFSQMPPAQAGEQFKDDFIQDFSDEENGVQRLGRLASRALQQRRQSLLQTAPSQINRNELEPSSHHGGPRRFRDASVSNTAMSRAVVLRPTERNHLEGGWAPRNELIGESDAALVGAFAPASRGRGRGKGTKKRAGGWKGRGKWGKSKGKKQGGARGRGRGNSGDNTDFVTRPSSSTGGFSRGDDANLRHVGGAEFSF